MNKVVVALIVLGLSFMSFKYLKPTGQGQPIVRNFETGEKLEYKMNYGFFPVGVAQVEMSDKLYKLNSRPCYKVGITARTVGAVDVVANVNDYWGAYFDTTNLLPYKSWRDISEGRYYIYEVTEFKHDSLKVWVRDRKEKGAKDWRKVKDHQVPLNVLDMISGFYYFRTLDFEGLRSGDIICVDAFFESQVYEFKIVYRGIETVKTKIGKFRAHKIAPIMPESPVFDGDDSLVAWISADKNKVPLRIDAKLFIGKASVELIDHQGLKYNMAGSSKN